MRTTALGFVALLGLLPNTALSAIDATFGLYVGAFFPSLDTGLRVDVGAIDSGTNIDLEGDLNFDDSDKLVRMGAFWRIAPRHRLFIDYYDIERNSSTRIQGDLIIDDEVFPVDTLVSAQFDTQVVPIYYEYSVYQTDTTEIGIGAGIHWLDIEFSIQATDSELREFSDASAPLPLLGASIDHRFAENWYFTASLYALSAKVNDVDGRMISSRAGIEYSINQAFSIGVGYDYFDLDVDLDKTDWQGNVGFSYNGPSVRVRYRY